MNERCPPIEQLLCPLCGEGLHQTSLGLACYSVPTHVYPFVEGVPCLIPTCLDDDAADTVETFRFKWEHSPEAALEERQRVATKWWFERFFPRGEQSLAVVWIQTFLRGRRILDAGCGLGNIAAMLARTEPSATVWGVDLSRAVHHAARLHRGLPNLHFLQADLTRLPIRGEFDLISADGVLHHTPDTRESYLALASRLAPGGHLLAYIYRRKAPAREFCDDWIRKQTTAMDPERCMEFSRSMTDLGRQLREAHVTLHIERDIPELGIAAGDHDLQRFIYWHFFKCFWDDGGNRVASDLENFDWYHPRLAHRHWPEEVRGWAHEAGLEVRSCEVGEAGIALWARRP